MAAKLFLLFLLAVAAHSLPKPKRRLREELAAQQFSSLLMPGPVISNENSMEVKKLDVSPKCILCEYIMEKLDEILSQNATEEEIQEALKNVCGLLPPDVSNECKEFVDKYADLVLKYLSQGLNPQIICTELELCQGANIIQEHTVNPIVVAEIDKIEDSTECELCETIAKQIQSLVTQNSTQQEIEIIMKKGCNILPEEIKTKCNAFVDQYLPEILNLLALEVSPEMFCKAIGLCKSSKVMGIEEGRLEAMAPKYSNLTCNFCLEIIGFAKRLAADNDTVVELENALKLVCYYMLLVYKECTNFIDNIIPKIFNELSKMDPDAICKAVDFCKMKNSQQ